jgi:hypothetical protein
MGMDTNRDQRAARAAVSSYDHQRGRTRYRLKCVSPTLDAAGPGSLATGWTGNVSGFRDRMDHAGSLGITQVIVAPSGPSIERELESFATTQD